MLMPKWFHGLYTKYKEVYLNLWIAIILLFNHVNSTLPNGDEILPITKFNVFKNGESHVSAIAWKNLGLVRQHFIKSFFNILIKILTLCTLDWSIFF